MRHFDPDTLPDRDPCAPQESPPCPHNEMIPNNDPARAWKCACCGYVYGDEEPDDSDRHNGSEYNPLDRAEPVGGWTGHEDR